MKIQNLAAFCVAAASAVLLGPVGTARAADEWFVMGEQTHQVRRSQRGDQDRRGSMAERRQAGKALCRGR